MVWEYKKQCFIVCVQGKVTIITGSGQGLGKAFAVRMLAAGAKVD